MATWAGVSRHYFDQIDSTNRQARLLAAGGAPHGTLCVANHQTIGRGRRGRAWESGPGMSLMLSIILRLPVEAPQRPLLSLAIALAAADACSAECEKTAMVKWPNDILINEKKVAGILLETEGDAVVAGIGINVRQSENDFPPDIRAKAASLQMQSGKLVAIENLEAALLNAIEKYIGEDCLDAYRKRCITIGRRVRVVSGGGEFSGVALDVNASGALLVDSEGTVRTVLAGDVSVRGEKGYV